MRRIRVARIITRLNVGGPAIQALLLAERLDPKRYQTLLVCGLAGAREGDMLALRGNLNVVPIRVPELRREIAPLVDLRALARLVLLLRRFRPDVVHTHMAKAGLLGRLAARVAGAPVVVHTFHGNVLRGYFDTTRAHFFLHLERLMARLSTRIVAISPRQRAEVLALHIAPPEKVVELPLGLDLAPFLEARPGVLRRELGIAVDVPLVGIVARLVPIKGVDIFIDAAARLTALRPDTHFIVVGDGELREQLIGRATSLGLGERVRFLGWRADLPAIYADLDVVALTSHNEGTPVSVIEALAAGRTVVATRVGGVPDLLEECGVLVEDGNAAGVADAIEALLADPARRLRLGEAGRRRVYPALDAATLLGNVDNLYTSLVDAL